MRSSLRFAAFSFLVLVSQFLLARTARADVHIIRIVEYYTQCNNGRTDVQYVEIRSISAGQFFRQCASIEIKRTVGGANLFFAKPLFAGHTNDESFPNGRSFLIATPAFQALTGVVPDLLIPNGTLPTAGGVIRFAADSGCEPFTNWGTIQEVRYGDQGTAPAPGPHQAAHFNTTLSTWSVSSTVRNPKNFANATVSNWNCDTGAPLVTLFSPDGGETLAVNSIHPITWSATDDGIITGITLEYSTNGGASYNPIAAGEANDGSFNWTIPNAPTSQALVRVTATDFALNAGVDVSNGVFTIFVPSAPDTTPPTVQVLRPNGGEMFIEGASEAITWNATDDVGVTSVDIEYTTDFGGLWKPIASGEANDGLFDWVVPNDEAPQAFVRILARDLALNAALDSSDASFAIQSLASVPFVPSVITKPMVLQNRPNPFNPGTWIGFALPTPGRVQIRIFSIDGRLVKTLLDGERGSGYGQVLWDGRDDQGLGAPSGVYFYVFDSGTVHDVRRMTLSK